jgi:sporulation protein YlmC with PRC-barrel domain
MQTGSRLNADRGEGHDLISASKVKGTDVYDASGDRIGEIDDVMITKRSGEIAYALMSFGGFLGIGEKYHPLPWDVLEYDTGLGGYRVGTAGENFRNAPSYSRDEVSSGSWYDQTDDFYDDAGRSGWLTRRRDGMPGTGGMAGTSGSTLGGGAAGRDF